MGIDGFWFRIPKNLMLGSAGDLLQRPVIMNLNSKSICWIAGVAAFLWWRGRPDDEGATEEELADLPKAIED